MKLHRIKIIAFLGITLLLVSCSQTAETVTETAEIPNTPLPTATDAGYPSPPIESPDDPGYPPPVVIPTIAGPGYPVPESDISEELYATAGPVPEPSASSGVVVGVIQVNNEPIPNLTIYLAEVLLDGEGLERVASYDRINSPRAFTNEDGQFVFSNVIPGRYGLVLDTVLSAYLLHLPQEDSALIISVEAGELSEIELLDYDSLPIPDSGE